MLWGPYGENNKKQLGNSPSWGVDQQQGGFRLAHIAIHHCHLGVPAMPYVAATWFNYWAMFKWTAMVKYGKWSEKSSKSWLKDVFRLKWDVLPRRCVIVILQTKLAASGRLALPHYHLSAYLGSSTLLPVGNQVLEFVEVWATCLQLHPRSMLPKWNQMELFMISMSLSSSPRTKNCPKVHSYLMMFRIIKSRTKRG